MPNYGVVILLRIEDGSDDGGNVLDLDDCCEGFELVNDAGMAIVNYAI
jgi:hypothetical protein